MRKPRVSVVIPAHNAARYLPQALDSVLGQTYPDWEAIVWDDGSTDGTREVVRKYQAKDDRIKYFFAENRGLSAARNSAIGQAEGEYIALLDADDVFLPAKLERQVAYLEKHPACDASYCDLRHFWDGRPETAFRPGYPRYSGADVFPNLFGRFFIAPLTLVFRRTAFDRFGYFDEAVLLAEDLDFWLRVSRRGLRADFLPEILCMLRLRDADNLQGPSNQPGLKRSALRSIEKISSGMTLLERKTYKIKYHLMRYRLKLVGAELLVGNRMGAAREAMSVFVDYPGGSILSRVLNWSVRFLPVPFWRWLVRRKYYGRRK